MRYIVSDRLDRPRVIIGHCGHCDENEDKQESGFSVQIEEKTIKNTNFREVLATNKHSQLVVMSLKPNEEIGEETHDKVDQFFRVEKGKGKFIANGQEKEVGDGDAFIIAAGTKHNVINTSDSEDLKVYTIYSPPNHPEGTIHKTKEDAEKED